MRPFLNRAALGMNACWPVKHHGTFWQGPCLTERDEDSMPIPSPVKKNLALPVDTSVTSGNISTQTSRLRTRLEHSG